MKYKKPIVRDLNDILIMSGACNSGQGPTAIPGGCTATGWSDTVGGCDAMGNSATVAVTPVCNSVGTGATDCQATGMGAAP